MIEIIYNDDNLKDENIDEKTVRSRGIIINNKDDVLMSYSNERRQYEFPGGHQEEVLKREIQEETGLYIDTSNFKPFIVIKYYVRNYRQTGKNRLVEIYYYEIKTEEKYDLAKANFDVNEIKENYECRYVNLSNL